MNRHKKWQRRLFATICLLAAVLDAALFLLKPPEVSEGAAESKPEAVSSKPLPPEAVIDRSVVYQEKR
ncbi:Uncharacterised protein [Neisseria animaloris]|uniref:Uncharacterized protein n=1 Tax=Neisseria animaloris TaxID=326522 RepID=A0A1X3CK22_9NEIS|nr:hypothetical protein [Neisseria animaloris]MDO5073341.1 hypothetical protein [Neisseria animaloris]OSI07956.1 hypothetical protein BWD08_04935 [Neisseria animaloris]VEH87608.1 Uncharacterised protein [Neisseria animaloris]VEJ22291.1 Uncharacterised protein [Neisseria animaloris]